MKTALILFWCLLALACIIYGSIIKSAETGTKFYRVWFLFAVVCFFFSLAVYLSFWQRLPGAIRFLFLFLVILCVVTFLIIFCLILTAYKKTAREGLDHLIVLGSRVRKDRPSVVLKYRLDEALDYLNRNLETLCIVTGGQGKDEPFPEAAVMADYLICHGISPERILQEDRSTSTVENIRFSMQLYDLSGGRTGIVTNNFHLFRALRIAKKQGLSNVEGLAANSRPLFFPHNLLREVGCVIKGILTGSM